jgi:two-component system, cell cycle sensor histidine kinase and response regulator CckA
MKVKVQSISRLMILSLILTTVLSVIISGSVWLLLEQVRNARESKSLRQRFLDAQKAESRREVIDVLEFVDFQRSRVELRIRTELDARLNEAENLMNGLRDIHAEYAAIDTALRSFRPDSGRIAFFLLNRDGTMVFNPIGRQLEGSNVLNLKNRQGRFIFREVIDSARVDRVSFIDYSWPKPNDPLMEHQRVLCVKRLPRFGLVLAVGEYIDDEETILQKELLARISTLRYGTDGYIYVYRFDGLCLNHIEPKYTGMNRWNLTDGNGLKVVQKIVETAQKPGGGFINYVASIKPSTGRPAKKTAFIGAVPDWRWAIGSGVYLDDIDKGVASRKTLMNLQMRQQFQFSLLILVVCLIVSLLLARLVMRYISREISVFSDSFEQTLKKMKQIDTNRLRFAEFGNLARTTNRLVEDRRKAERALAESESKLRALFETARDAIFIKDTSMRYSFVNEAMGRIYGIDPNDFIGHTYNELVAADRKNQIGKDDLTVLQGRVVERELHLPLIRPVIMHVIKAPLRDADGNIIGLCGIGRDLTEYRRAEMELRQAQKMESIGTLASGIAHDFNNILSAIMGYTELATFKSGKNTEMVSHLNEILKACNRAKDLVRQILAFSSRREDEEKPVQMSIVVKDTMKMMRASLPSTIQIVTDFQSEAKVLSDPTQLHQIVVNLCTNAFHAMREHGGTLSVSLHDLKFEDIPERYRFQLKEGDYLMFRVEDTGHGIPPEIIERIFEPYFTSKAPDEGTGLGLAIVHRIVENHGGRIQATSEVGVGTVFEIILPQAEADEELVERVDAGELEITPTSILFVDDEESIVDIVCKNLTYFGYQVRNCNSSPEALEVFRGSPDKFDLLVTDMTMPSMTGVDLTREILAIRPDLPVILTTGFSNNVTLESLKNSGVWELIYKPFDIQALIFLIEKVRRGMTNHDVVE